MLLNPEVLEDAEQLTLGPATHEGSLFGDIPGPVWTAFLSAWALLFALFVMFFAKDGPSSIAILTSCFFATMILGLPAALAGQSQAASRPWPRMIVTGSGTLPVGAAAAQILLIPVGAVIGLIGFIVLAL